MIYYVLFYKSLYYNVESLEYYTFYNLDKYAHGYNN